MGAAPAVTRPRPTRAEPDAYKQRPRSRLAPRARCTSMTTRPGNRLARPRLRLLSGTDRGALHSTASDHVPVRSEPGLRTGVLSVQGPPRVMSPASSSATGVVAGRGRKAPGGGCRDHCACACGARPEGDGEGGGRLRGRRATETAKCDAGAGSEDVRGGSDGQAPRLWFRPVRSVDDRPCPGHPDTRRRHFSANRSRTPPLMPGHRQYAGGSQDDLPSRGSAAERRRGMSGRRSSPRCTARTGRPRQHRPNASARAL